MFKFLFLVFSLIIMLLLQSGLQAQSSTDQRLQPYVEVLQNRGEDPLSFVIDKLNTHDLLIFDDAWHPVVEPFDFYQKLINTPSFSEKVRYIFVEAFSINKQKYILFPNL